MLRANREEPYWHGRVKSIGELEQDPLGGGGEGDTWSLTGSLMICSSATDYPLPGGIEIQSDRKSACVGGTDNAGPAS